MASLARVRLAITGWNGAPGCNTFYFSPGTTGAWTPSLADNVWMEVHSFVTSLKNHWVGGAVLTVESEVPVIDPRTGDITEMLIADDTAGPVIVTGGDGALPRSTSACVTLKTGQWVNGRQLQGRHYLGPLQGAVIDNNGHVSNEAVNALEDGYVAMISGLGPRLSVWSRPKAGGLKPGYYHDVVDVRCNQLPTNLRSRRQ